MSLQNPFPVLDIIYKRLDQGLLLLNEQVPLLIGRFLAGLWVMVNLWKMRRVAKHSTSQD